MRPQWRTISVLVFLVAAACGDSDTVVAETETGSSSDTGGGSGLPDGGPGQPDGGPGLPDDTADDTTTTTTTTLDGTSSDTTIDPTLDGSSTTGEPPPECERDVDCAADNPCVVATCDAGVCVVEAIDEPDDAVQTPGDCQVVVCADGVPAMQDADADVPDDANACTVGVCTDGVPSQDPVAVGEPCGNGLLCDGAGQCVGCVTAADCTDLPPDDDCQTRTCEAGVCGQAFADAGTPVTMQTTGDCQEIVCDGSGGTMSVDDDTDPFDDGLQCTDDICDVGVPDNPPVAEGTACGTDGLCNDVGECVGCVTAADCGGQDTFCQSITCIAGVCGVDNTPADTALPPEDQTDNDCQVLVCDGNGLSQSIADDTDLPVDDGSECSTPVCTAGVPGSSPEPATTPCGNPAASACDAPDSCDGNGACVPNFATQGAACGTQGVPCQINDACDGQGACVDNGPAAPGTACGDPTTNACTAADTCDASGICLPNHAAPGTICGDQGITCVNADTCNGSGVCVDNGFAAPGTACGDPSNTDCDDPDSCDGAGSCQPNFLPGGAVCTSDGEYCSGPELCTGAAACVSTGTPCGAGEVCVEATDECIPICMPSCVGLECGDDGCGGSCGMCPGGEVCTAGTCEPICTPSCVGLECGDDGCGGSCGTCPGGEVCTAGTCEPICTPSCGVECGDDGCGGSCGTCDVGLVCSAGVCVTLEPWINELHYDNEGTDTGEFVEVAVPSGFNPSEIFVALYNNGTSYWTFIVADFSLGTTVNGVTLYLLALPTNLIQNGPADGISLYYIAGNGSFFVAELLSYEGTFFALDGVAAGLLSTDIGVAEDANTPIGASLGRVGSGAGGPEFTWAVIADDTPGDVNVGQVITP